MDSWAEEQAAQIVSANKKAEETTKARLRLYEVIRDGSKPFFDNTAKCVGRYVDDFNRQATVQPPLRWSHSESTIDVVKESFPRVDLRITLDNPPIQVCVCWTTKVSIFSEHELTEGALRFGLDPDGQLRLESEDPDGIARSVLKRVFDAFRAAR